MTIIASPTAPYAPIARRLGGYLIDGALSALVLGALGVAPALLTGKPALLAVGYVAAAAVGVVQWLLLAKRGYTVGKYVAGTRVVDAETGGPLGLARAFIRYLVLGLLASCFVLLIVLLFAIAGDRRKQGWHDKAAGSVEITAPPTREGEMWTLEPGSAILPSTGAARTGPVPPPPPAPPSAAPPAGPTSAPPSVPPPPVAPLPKVTPPPVEAVPSLPAGGLVAPPPGLATPPVVDETIVGRAVSQPPAPPTVPTVPSVPAVPPTPVAPIDEETRRPAAGEHRGSTAATTWVLRTGEEEHTVGTTVVIGRDPELGDLTGATGWSVDDPTYTVSKTHAVVELLDGLLSIEDLDSTHGILVRRNGDEVPLEPRRATRLLDGDVVVLGVVEIQVVGRP